MEHPSMSWFYRQFIINTTFAKLAILTIFISSFLAFTGIIKETNPDLEVGIGIVVTEWSKGDAQSIEVEVTNPLERELKSLQGLKRLQSGSYAGFSIIIVEFYPDVDQNDAMTRLRSKVAGAEGELPSDADKPDVIEASVNDSPIFSFRLYGDVPSTQKAELADKLKRELEQVKGVNQVNVAGANPQVVNIRLIAARLSAMGLSATTIESIVQQNNMDMPLDQFDGEAVGVNFRLEGKYRNIEDLQYLPISTNREGHTTYLRDVAEVYLGTDKQNSATYFANQGEGFTPAIDISLTKRSGADAIKTIEGVKSRIERFKHENAWPDNLQISIVVDHSESIITDLKNVFTSAWQAMLAVFMILLISLSWREAIVAGLAIPITLMLATSVIFALGFTLNQIVIIGMVLALGLLVDDFILMMEGLHESIFSKGKSFVEAAVTTVKTYALPSLSGSLTTILVMVPLMLIAGIEGKFIRLIPITTIICLIASYLISILLAIPMAKYFLNHKQVSKSAVDRLTAQASVSMEGIIKAYFIRSKPTAIGWIGLSTGVLLVSTHFFGSYVPLELSPKGDGRSMGMTIELSPDASLKTAQQCGNAIGNVLRSQESLETVTLHIGEKSPFSLVSASDQLSPTTGHYLVGVSLQFVESNQRNLKVYEYIPVFDNILQQALLNCPGGEVYYAPELGRASAEDPIQIVVSGPNMQVLKEKADDIKRLLQVTPGTSGVRDNYGTPKTALVATPDREALSFYNLSLDSFANQVRRLMSHDKVGEFIQGDGEENLDIKMGFAWPSRDGEPGGPQFFAELSFLTVVTDDGLELPLSSVASFELTREPLSYLHRDGQRAITVMAQTQGKTAGEILDALEPQLNELKASWPPAYRIVLSGEAEASEETFGSALKMMFFAAFLVFALLTLQFDSFKQPFIIMSIIPLALIGVFFGFMIVGIPFSFFAMVGVIALIGIVVNDTIIMVQTMNNHIKSGNDKLTAAAKGASDRLRPIITTSVTTIVGLLPLAFSQERWLPLSLTVIAGLLIATLLALFIVPCIYYLLTTKTGILNVEGRD